MNVVREEEIYTMKDIYALPDGERAELIDAATYYMSPPSTKRQRVLNFWEQKGARKRCGCYC